MSNPLFTVNISIDVVSLGDVDRITKTLLALHGVKTTDPEMSVVQLPDREPTAAEKKRMTTAKKEAAAAKKKAAKKKPALVIDDDLFDDDDDTEVTMDDIKDAARKMIEEQDTQAVRDILAKFGVTKLQDIDPEQYTKVLAAIQAE